MITSLFIKLVEIIVGLAGGLAVGAGFVAFITLLGIIPRLVQLSKSDKFIQVFSACVIAGSIFGTFLSFSNINWNHSIIFFMILRGLHGIFNGLLASAISDEHTT